MLKKFLIIGIALTLARCSVVWPDVSETELQADEREFSDWSDFSFRPSMEIREKIKRDDGSFAFTTYETMSMKKDKEDFNIHLHRISGENCRGNLIGVWEPKSWTNGIHAIWGKVDYFNGEIPDYEEEPLCRPISGGAGYGFCAQKGDTSVVICVAQVTDNEKQAEEIFKTFKWTE